VVQVMASKDSLSNNASIDNSNEDNYFQPLTSSSRSESDKLGMKKVMKEVFLLDTKAL
jgi:hypothetical protein